MWNGSRCNNLQIVFYCTLHCILLHTSNAHLTSWRIFFWSVRNTVSKYMLLGHAWCWSCKGKGTCSVRIHASDHSSKAGMNWSAYKRILDPACPFSFWLSTFSPVHMLLSLAFVRSPLPSVYSLAPWCSYTSMRGSLHCGMLAFYEQLVNQTLLTPRTLLPPTFLYKQFWQSAIDQLLESTRVCGTANSNTFMVQSSPQHTKTHPREKAEENLEEELLFIQSPFSKWYEELSEMEQGKILVRTNDGSRTRRPQPPHNLHTRAPPRRGRRGSGDAVTPRVLEHQPLVLKTSFSTSAAENSLVFAATSKTRNPVISKDKRSSFYLTLNCLGFQRRIVLTWNFDIIGFPTLN